MKKRTKISIIGLCLVFVMVAIVPSVSSRIPMGRQMEIVYSQNQQEMNYVSAESTLEPFLDTYLNSDASGPSNVVVEYDVKTGTETEYTVDYDEIHSELTRLEPYIMERQSSDDNSPMDSLRPAVGPEDLDQVMDTEIFPFSAVVKVITDLNSTHIVVGSGAMIDANHVLTAGHVVYDAYEGGWRENVRVAPGKNGPGETFLTEPYGRAYATHMRSTSGWTQFGYTEHDWAVITLDRDIGDETGWLGVANIPYTHYNYSDRVYTAGYPATTLSGNYMYNITGIGGYCSNEYEHRYTFYGEGGQSGSSVWTYQEGNPYVISIFAYGPAPGFGTRITSTKFDLINLWIEQDSTDTPKPDLEVVGSNNILADLGYDKNIVIVFSEIPVATSIFNYGNFDVDKAILKFYLSEDEEITVDDYKIGRLVVNDIGAFSSVDVSDMLRVPIGVPAGLYEIGWIIDPDDRVDEFLEENNSYLDGLQLRIISTFLDQLFTKPLYLSLLIVGLVSIIGIPTVLAIVKKAKRKKLAA